MRERIYRPFWGVWVVVCAARFVRFPWGAHRLFAIYRGDWGFFELG